MKKSSFALSKIFVTYAGSSLWKKMMIGYIVVILIPSVFFISSYLTYSTNQLFENYLINEQRSMQQSNANFVSKLSQLQSSSQLFQNNKSVSNYLRGVYRSESDEVYTYLEDIKPLFTHIMSSNQEIGSLTIYSARKPKVPLSSHIVYKEDMADLLNELPLKGRWVFTKDNDTLGFNFQIPLYSIDYSRREAYLNIDVSSHFFANLFNDRELNKAQLLYANDTWYEFKNDRLVQMDLYADDNPFIKVHIENADKEKQPGRKTSPYLVNELILSSVDAKIISITPKSSITNENGLYITYIGLIALFIVLSVLYYIIIASTTRRLLKFSKHIRKVDYNFLEMYMEKDRHDEISQVIHAYNEAIAKISDLINNLNIANLKKKEADFYALQAQIKPHFIYNSLETVRMMAEANDDCEVADTLYNLGGFIRYSMSTFYNEVLLEKEIENVRKYLQIYKVSMGERFAYSICIEGDIGEVKCPGFMIQPLVENSLHHGISDHRQQLQISLSVLASQDSIVISVRDNGAGIPAHRLSIIQKVLLGELGSVHLEQRGTGIGIGNISERVQNYYGKSASLVIHSELSKGTDCRINISREVTAQ